MKLKFGLVSPSKLYYRLVLVSGIVGMAFSAVIFGVAIDIGKTESDKLSVQIGKNIDSIEAANIDAERVKTLMQLEENDDLSAEERRRQRAAVEGEAQVKQLSAPRIADRVREKQEKARQRYYMYGAIGLLISLLVVVYSISKLRFESRHAKTGRQ